MVRFQVPEQGPPVAILLQHNEQSIVTADGAKHFRKPESVDFKGYAGCITQSCLYNGKISGERNFLNTVNGCFNRLPVPFVCLERKRIYVPPLRIKGTYNTEDFKIPGKCCLRNLDALLLEPRLELTLAVNAFIADECKNFPVSCFLSIQLLPPFQAALPP